MNKYSFIIPYYNHPQKISQLCEALKKYNLHILIVNDGSDEKNSKVLKDLENVEILNLSENGGKGRALKEGFFYLKKKGFSHAIQLDADFQHEVNDVSKFLELSHKYPRDFICSSPIYGEDAPKSRLYGRKITNFWIFINTKGGLSNDGMCGFRLYPLKEIEKALLKTKSDRMDFDVEILVRAFWENISFHWIETKVRYNSDVSSHFRAFKDNYLISKMHARMFFYMLFNKLFKR